ncbi:MAG: hypothetical protein ACOCW8_01120 [bacterium]
MDILISNTSGSEEKSLIDAFRENSCISCTIGIDFGKVLNLFCNKWM